MQVCNDIVETGKTSWDDIAGACSLIDAVMEPACSTAKAVWLPTYQM